MTLQAGILGPLEASVDGKPVQLTAAKPRALLALLLLERNRTVAQNTLIDGIWGEDPPATAAKAVQTYVSQLRKVLGADALVHRPPGYVLQIAPGQLDLDRFNQLVAEAGAARDSGDRARSSGLLREALGLWRGSPLEEFRDLPFAEPWIAALEESRLSALEARIDDDLARGAQRGLVAELERLVERFPYREGLRGRLMLALYREGRQAEALEVYRRGRDLLVDELGLEPSRELQELEQSILRHDDALALTLPSASLPAVAASVPAHGARRRPSSAALVATVILVALLVAIVLAIALRDDGFKAAGTNGSASASELTPFVDKLENLLGQSHEARGELGALIAAAQRCSITSRQALIRLDLVERSRQSLLDQSAALTVPEDDGARTSARLFHVSIQRSIASDWLYRRWLTSNERCPRPAPPTARADAQATGAKSAFLAAFNPLATKVGKRSWRATEF